MRILFLTTHLEFGGIPVYTVMLATALKQRGHEPIVASRGGVLVERLTAAKIPHVSVAVGIKSELHPTIAVAVAQVVGIIHRARPDLLHAQTRVAHVVAGLAGWLTGVPVVTTAHGFSRWRWGRRHFPCWGRRVIAVSRAVARVLTLVSRVPRARVVLIPNGIAWDPMEPRRLAQQAAWFSQVWGLPRGGPIIGSIARLNEAKGEHVLLEAFHRVRRQIPSARLLLVGDGPQKSALIRQAYAFGDEDHVVIAGPVEHTAIPLSVMDVFVLPSRDEAFGLALVEAMAMRRPVVASAVGGMREIVRHGETGFLVPPGNPGALADALRYLVEHPDAARALGEAGYRRFQERFTIDRMAADVERVYKQVLAELRSV